MSDARESEPRVEALSELRVGLPLEPSVGVPPEPSAQMPLWHVAFSVHDLRVTHRWYHDTLGLLYARGTSLMMGPLVSWSLGLRGVATSCWWLNDSQDLFQLEMFEFRRPVSRALPVNWRPCDIGYAMLSVHVADLDATLARAQRNGSPPLTVPLGPHGARRACVRDPDGVLLELMEDDPRQDPPRERPRAGVPTAVRGVTLSVADLERSRRLFVQGLGLSEATDVRLHTPEHEALWGLAGAARDTVLLWAGDFLVELVSYRRPRAPEREPGWRTNDRGLYHICFGSLDRAEYRTVVRRCRAAGWHGNSPVISAGASAAVFVVDDQGFTVELLNRHPRLRQATDATLRSTPRLLPLRIDAPAKVRRQRCFGGAVVIGADTPIGIELCQLMAEDGTSLWLLDAPEALLDRLRASTGAPARSVDVAALRAGLGAPLGSDDESAPELIVGLPLCLAPAHAGPSALRAGSPPAHADPSKAHAGPQAPSSLVLLALLLPAATGVRHVTAIARPAARRELAVLRAQLAHTDCTSTLAVLSEGKPRFAGIPLLPRESALSAREAAEGIYLATLRRRRSLRLRPGLRFGRGPSEAPAAGGARLSPPSPARRRDVLRQLPEPI